MSVLYPPSTPTDVLVEGIMILGWFNSLGLNKTEDIRDKLDLEEERWD